MGELGVGRKVVLVVWLLRSKRSKNSVGAVCVSGKVRLCGGPSVAMTLTLISKLSWNLQLEDVACDHLHTKAILNYVVRINLVIDAEDKRQPGAFNVTHQVYL